MMSIVHSGRSVIDASASLCDLVWPLDDLKLIRCRRARLCPQLTTDHARRLMAILSGIGVELRSHRRLP